MCSKKNKEKEKENGSTSIVELAWRSYRNKDEKGREIEEIDMEKEKNGRKKWTSLNFSMTVLILLIFVNTESVKDARYKIATS